MRTKIINYLPLLSVLIFCSCKKDWVDTKPYGNILDFRGQQEAVDTAIALFSGANADKAREICQNPVWIKGFAHYSELHNPGMRDLLTSPSTTLL